jgi:hypothetical protein
MPVSKGAGDSADNTNLYDPQTILTEISPGPSSPDDATASDDDDSAQPFSEPQPAQERSGEAEDGSNGEFPDDLRADFQALLAGKPLIRTFHWLGHRYTIRAPLTSGELMEVGLLTKPFADSLGATKAYQVAVLAGCVIRYDDEPMPIPAKTAKATLTDIDPTLLDRFNLIRQWFPPTVDALYEQYLLLEGRVMEVVNAMGNPQG